MAFSPAAANTATTTTTTATAPVEAVNALNTTAREGSNEETTRNGDQEQPKVLLLKRDGSTDSSKPPTPQPATTHNGDLSANHKDSSKVLDSVRAEGASDLIANLALEDKNDVASIERDDVDADEPPPELDPVLKNALSNQRDRVLLVKSERELERFMANTS